jgi:hypothetical protein
MTREEPGTAAGRANEASIAEIAEGLAEIGAGGTPAFIRGYNRGYDDAYEHLADEYREATDAAMNYGDGYNAGRADALREDVLAAAINAADAHEWDLGGSAKWAAAIARNYRALLAAEPAPAAVDADGDPIPPDPHSPDWYDGYAEGQRDAAEPAPAETPE